MNSTHCYSSHSSLGPPLASVHLDVISLISRCVITFCSCISASCNLCHRNGLVTLKTCVFLFPFKVLPLENEMREPKYFPDVVKYGMTIVMIVYISMGCFGYLTCMDHCEGSITLNLPGTPYVYSHYFCCSSIVNQDVARIPKLFSKTCRYILGINETSSNGVLFKILTAKY